MFHVVGFTCLNSSFSAACVFMAKETEEYYLWTLEQFKDVFNINPGVFLTDKEKALINAVRNVFPTSGHVLCLFHIVQNLIQIKNAKGISDPAWKIFVEHFYSVIQSEAVEEFCWNLDVMTGKYENDRECGDAFIYLINNWFDMKESFCYYNIDQFTHFETYTNNRAESAHNTLKSGDRMYKRDLESVMENVMATMEHQVIDLRRNFDVDKQRVDRELINTPLFVNVIRHVSSFALLKVLQIIAFSQTNHVDSVCSGRTERITGIPCIHSIKRTQRLSKDMFHRQWWLDEEEESGQISKPVEELFNQWRSTESAADKVRLEEAANVGLARSAHRYEGPKVHEENSRVMRTQKKKTARKCRVCRQEGHDSRSHCQRCKKFKKDCDCEH
ncbi:hypothetical protein GEMRC1_010510 [Eukaryota sp. GEM-RC1]